jgi:hypothetical protein
MPEYGTVHGLPIGTRRTNVGYHTYTNQPRLLGMEHGETYRRTLEYALAIAGSESVLSVRMKVTPGTLKNWLCGISPVPARAFLDAVDIILAATPAEIARSRELMLKHSPHAPHPA